MTVTSERAAGHGGSPVDFATYGDYGDYRKDKDRPAQEKETSWPHAATPTASRHVAKAAARSSRFELAEMRWRQVLNVL